MSNNLALFVTHHVFLTDDQILSVVSGETTSQIGHCVPVWVNAKTGKTTEPAKEVFCKYEISVANSGQGDVEPIFGLGYKIVIPKSLWTPPEEIDFEEISSWEEKKRDQFLKAREDWWFRNPKPMDVKDLARGYLRFDVRKQGLKSGKKVYSAQHVVEISNRSALCSSLTT